MAVLKTQHERVTCAIADDLAEKIDGCVGTGATGKSADQSSFLKKARQDRSRESIWRQARYGTALSADAESPARHTMPREVACLIK